MLKLELTEDERGELFRLRDWLDRLEVGLNANGLSAPGVAAQQRFVDRLIAKLDQGESGVLRG